MKRRTLYWGLLVAVVVLTYIAFAPFYSFKYFYSKDKKYVVTRIDRKRFLGNNSTFFTMGYYRRKKVPPSFIKPYYNDWSGQWEGYIHFNKSGAIYYSIVGECETRNLSPHFLYVAGGFITYKEKLRLDSLSDAIKSDPGNSYEVKEKDE